MTATLDTNIFVFAVDESSPRQGRSRDLLDWVASGPRIFHLFWPALIGFIRIVTHPAILARPLSTNEAVGAVDRLVGRPHIRVDGEPDDFWETFRRVAFELKARGNLVSDVHLVALMQQHGVSTIWTHDRDFRKFSGITMRDPFETRYSEGFE